MSLLLSLEQARDLNLKTSSKKLYPFLYSQKKEKHLQVSNLTVTDANIIAEEVTCPPKETVMRTKNDRSLVGTFC